MIEGFCSPRTGHPGVRRSREAAIDSQSVPKAESRPYNLSPQSQSFSRSYGSILPTSLIYIVLSTRGCSPWRPDAVMGTTWQDRYAPPDFHGPSSARRTLPGGSAVPASEPYLRMTRFQGRRAVKEKRKLSPGPTPASPGSLTLPSNALSR